LPDFADQGGVGVVGIQGVAARSGQFGFIEEGGELVAGPGELFAGFVEGLGDGAPAGPAGQDRLLLGGGRAGVVLESAQDGEGGQVGADAGDDARGG
jgi:hypothetical protein